MSGSPALRRAALLWALLAGGACARRPLPVAAPTCPVPARTLTDVRALDPSIRLDLRYATPDNFTGRPLPGYDARRALLRPEAAAALARVQARLRGHGLGLKIWDAYRPVRATLAMVAWAEQTGNEWVLDQGYVARESGHNLGGTVDLTLVRLDTGAEVDMGTPYDHFSERAHTANAAGTLAANRQRLVQAMAAEGFANYDKEWWHFRHPGDWRPLDAPLSCFRDG